MDKMKIARPVVCERPNLIRQLITKARANNDEMRSIIDTGEEYYEASVKRMAAMQKEIDELKRRAS